MKVSYTEQMRIALEAQVSLSSVKKRLAGGTVRGEAGLRLEGALAKRGLVGSPTRVSEKALKELGYFQEKKS